VEDELLLVAEPEEDDLPSEVEDDLPGVEEVVAGLGLTEVV